MTRTRENPDVFWVFSKTGRHPRPAPGVSNVAGETLGTGSRFLPSWQPT
jgi:hypothetical protein